MQAQASHRCIRLILQRQTQNGSPDLTGSPSTPQHGTNSIDLAAYAEALKGSATTTLTADESGATYGTSSNYVTVYSDARTVCQQGRGHTARPRAREKVG